MKFIIIIFILFFHFNGLGCINLDTARFKDGSILYTKHSLSLMPEAHRINYSILDHYVNKFDSLYHNTQDLEYLADKALVLIYLGKYQESINIYLQIEEKLPNKYSTASNIGTAYELNGQNDEALKWIHKSIQIEPSSHFYSEWIHENILKVKIAGDQYISSNSLINTDFGQDVNPTTKLSKEQLNKLRKSIKYQLDERMTFVKEESLIVGNLLFDLGNIMILTKNLRTAEKLYKKALEYGFKNNLIQKRLDAIVAYNNR